VYEKDPEAFVAGKYAAKILARIQELTKPGIRAGEKPRSQAQVLNLQNQDVQTGKTIFDDLWKQAENVGATLIP
jgi:hypothetical protein